MSNFLGQNLQELADNWIEKHLNTGRFPSGKWLSLKINSTQDEAQSLIDSYRSRMNLKNSPLSRLTTDKTKESVKMIEEKKEPQVQGNKKEEIHHIHTPIILKIIGQFGLYVALSIDLASGLAFYLSISVDQLTMVALVLISLVAVLYKIKAFWEGKKGLWLIFAICTWYTGVSYLSNSLIVQSEQVRKQESSAKIDFTEINNDIKKAKNNLDELNINYRDIGTGYRSELAVRLEGIKEAKKTVEELEAKKERMQSKKEVRSIEINSSETLIAIPKAFTSKNTGIIIGTIIFMILFLGLELAIISSINPKKHQKDES